MIEIQSLLILSGDLEWEKHEQTYTDNFFGKGMLIKFLTNRSSCFFPIGKKVINEQIGHDYKTLVTNKQKIIQRCESGLELYFDPH